MPETLDATWPRSTSDRRTRFQRRQRKNRLSQSRGRQTLKAANHKLARLYPGDATARQPVHTLICSGDAFRRDSVRAFGAAALTALDEFAPTPASFAKTLGMTDASSLAETVYARVIGKLKREPVEDLRLGRPREICVDDDETIARAQGPR